MTSFKEPFQESRRNDLRLSPVPNSSHNEPNHQSHQAVSTDLFLNPRRSSQRNKHGSPAPGSLPPSLKRRTSRFGLSGLFGRSKPLIMEEVQEQLEVHSEREESIGTSISVDTAGLQRIDSQTLTPEGQTPQEIHSPAATVQGRASKSMTGYKGVPRTEAIGRSLTTWEPPPLVQAYPQAVKHATLKGPLLPVETILRLNAERGSSSNPRVESFSPEVNTMRNTKEKKLKKPTASDVLSKRDWVDKTFVLLTSGYLLQYAGQGSVDRLPEKMMLLSKDSVAFASDAIPGRPYVLQVSQISNEDGALDREASRSMFKNRGLRNQMKRSTCSLLLVFQNAEELSAWMAAVRKEIKNMGGQGGRPDEHQKPLEVASSSAAYQRLGQRNQSRTDPNPIRQAPTPSPNVMVNYNTVSPENSIQVADSVDSSLIKRQSMATQQSVDSRATSNTAESINQIHLDRLKESPRQSYASTAGRTASTSRDSSPGSSPVKLHADVPQWAPSLNERRQTTSMYHGLVKSSVRQLTLPNKSRQESTISPTPTASPSSQSAPKLTLQQRRTPSPTAPNFSVPTFSKRYSTSSKSPAMSCSTPKCETQPTSLTHTSLSPPVMNDEQDSLGRRASAIRGVQRPPKPSLKVSNGLAPSNSTPPRSAGSCAPPNPVEGDRPFSRRFSSLEYSRGISPLQLFSQSPSPHPPPTTALPPLPGTIESQAISTTPTAPVALRASPSAKISPRTLATPSPPPPLTALSETGPARMGFLYPPPTRALPAVPDVSPSSYAGVPPSSPKMSDERAGSKIPKDSVIPQVEKSVPIVPKIEALQASALIQTSTIQESTKPDLLRSRGPRRPVSMQVRSQPYVNHAMPPHTDFKAAFGLENIGPPPTKPLPSPPRPTRNPPPPPAEQIPKLITNTDSTQAGREPPPVSALPSPRSKISVVSPATNYFEGAAPHPFIPPIKVSERKFRGSLDGPWNPGYGAPQRNFFDLGAV